jgi:branched-chain amino acid transport system permease protein
MLDYLVLVLILVAINAIVAIGLNIQWGYTGLLNLSSITYVGIGGYVAMVVALPPAGTLGAHYILGLGLPFPIAVVAAIAVCAVLGTVVGAVALNRVRAYYLAIVTFCIAEIIHQLVSNYIPLFNGNTGLYGLDPPFLNVFGPAYNNDLYLGLCVIVLIAVFLFAERLRKGSFGRALRAVRDDNDAARAFGRNVFRLQLKAFVLGCAIAGLGGALLVNFTGALNPDGWTSGETLLLLAAVFLGGSGNNWGVVLGMVLVLGVLGQGTTFIPSWLMTNQQQAAFQAMLLGVLLIVILRFRPEGILPEAIPRDIAATSSGGTARAA